MNACPLCASAIDDTDETCPSCGASIAWLERAPATLREKLGRGVRGTVGVATVSVFMHGCTACAAGCQADPSLCDVATYDTATRPDADAALDAGADR